jgi:PPP family 3-phenylpropionic acid transporter
MALSTRRALIPFLVLFAALYAGFGVQSPYLHALLEDRGVRLEGIGIVLAVGTALRLVAGPAGGRLADRLDAAKLVFAGCAGAASLMALLFLTAEGFWPLFAVSLLQAAALAPLAPLCDSLALGAAAPARRDDATGPGFEYGWVAGCRLQRLHCRGATVRASRGALRPRGGHLA